MEANKDAATAPHAVHVCARCGSRDLQVTAWVDMNTRAIVAGDGPLATAWCPVCESQEEATVEVEWCEDCDGKGWEVYLCERAEGDVREVQRCDLCERLAGDFAAADVARGAGLDVTASCETTEAAERRWRAGYRRLARWRPPPRRAGASPEITPGEIARAIAHQPQLREPAPGVAWGEHRHDGTATHAAFDWWVSDHGRPLCFAIVVYRNPSAESGS